MNRSLFELCFEDGEVVAIDVVDSPPECDCIISHDHETGKFKIVKNRYRWNDAANYNTLADLLFCERAKIKKLRCDALKDLVKMGQEYGEYD